MKQKILYLLLFICSISYAQIPTNGLQAMYEFTNGSLVDTANSNNFTQTGTALTQVNDRLNNTTRAISLNGDYLTRPFFSHNGHIAYSFWVKTTTDTFEYKTIIDDSQKNGGSNNFASTQKGYSIMLYRGKVIADVRMQHRARFNNIQAYSGTTATSGFIADGNWHHIVVRFQARSRSGNFYGLASVHVDGALHEERDQFYANAGTVPFFDIAGDIVVANNKNNTINSNLKYNDAIDDILIYNRELTAQEILNIRNVGGFCVAPSNSLLSSTVLTETSIDLVTPATSHDIAYHKSSEPFSSATIVPQVINSVIINGLNPSTPYKFYIRTPCAVTGSSQWSTAKTIRTEGTVYVNNSATGDNDGSSWANAYTDLRNPVRFSNPNTEFWVAGGTYKAHATRRDVYFHVEQHNLKIYGGFTGNETSISQRVVGTNETILSGDLQDDDANLTDYALNYANTTRNADNSYHIINIAATGNNLLLDGLTISDAHTNLSPTERGGAIIKEKTVTKFTLKNCIIKDNVSRNDNAGLLAEFELNNAFSARGALIVENCKFINNMSRWASGIYSFVRNNSKVDITVVNSLFDNNLAGDLNSSVTGIGGSAAWFRTLNNGSNTSLNLTNNTFVNNIDIGTNSVNNLTKAVVAISNESGATGVFNAQVNNCIFWGNTGTGGATTRSITDLYKVPVSSLVINNSIDELDFNDDSITSKTNTTDSDPLFTSATDYTLQSASPAKDGGDNAKVIGNTDLLGNNRIFNTTVDMGAYEFGSPLYVERTLTINATNGTVATNPNPNGNGAYADGTSVVLTATPDSGYQFDGWSGDAGGTSTIASVVMFADRTVTATFSLIPAPTPYVINLPAGNTATDEFTASIEFDAGVTGFTMSDITVTGATLSNFTATNAANYSFKVTPTSVCNRTVTLQVLANVAQDAQTNVNNNASSVATITITDGEKPTVTVLSNTPLNLPVNTNGGGAIVSAAALFNFSDNCTMASSLTVVLSKGTTASTGTSQVNAVVFDCSEIGTQSITLKVIDGAGNIETETTTVNVIDNISPTVVAQNITVQLGTNGQVAITTADVNNGSSDNCAISSMSLDTTSFTCNSLGANNVILTVADASGNTNTATAVVTVNQNPNAQLAAVTQNITVQLDANGNATITPSQVDNGSGSGCNSNPTLSLDITSFTCANLGANTVTLTATDLGNSVSNTATVTVVDVIAPTVVAQDFTLQLDASGQGTLTVANIDNGSSDNCAITTSVLDKTSFDCSNIGANTVKLTVIDASNNSSDVTVTVTVEDKIDPIVVAKNITVQLGTNGVVSIVASDVYNSTSDNCSVTSVSIDKTNFTCNDLGANNVVLTVNDASGNTNTATAVVTVNQNPNAQLAAVTQNITVQLDANGNATITPSQVDNGSGSGCNSNPTLSLDITSFTCANLGANTVTLTATDLGNSVSNTATVTVVDVIAPTVVAQDFTLQLDASGQGTLTVANIDNGSSDNCAITTSVLDKTSFDCSNIGANTVKLTVIDASNNSSDVTVTVTVEDKIDPTAIAQDISVQLGAGGQVTITASDVNNGSSDNCTTTANLTYSLDTTSFSCSEVGTNNVVLTVTDASGNTATANAVVKVSENPNLPLATVTQDITVQLDANGSVTITPSQVDNGSGSGCNSTPTLTLDVATFDCSNIGVNTVTLTANDGTTSVTATATVTVEDKAAPTVTTQGVTVTLDAAGQGSITVTDIDNGSTDNCSIATRTLDVTSFTCANLGANTVTLTIVDVNGNTADATAVVTVTEAVAPTVVTQNITVAVDVDGNLNITPQQIDNGSSDSCSGIATMSLDQTSFSCPTLGDVIVTLTVTDNSGNSATETAIVTITGSDEDNDGISDACDSKEIIFSKGFSPNGDGQNDTWVIENIDNYPNNKVAIFNRWGEKMYQANDYKNDWDGKANQRGGSNEKLPVGSYLYIIHFNEPGVASIQGWLYINY